MLRRIDLFDFFAFFDLDVFVLVPWLQLKGWGSGLQPTTTPPYTWWLVEALWIALCLELLRMAYGQA